MWKSAVFSILALATLVVYPATANIVYQIGDYPEAQAGYHLTGQVVTDGTIGLLSSSNILSYNFKATGPFLGFVGSGSGATVHNAYATSTQIILQQSTTPGEVNRFEIGDMNAALLIYEDRPPGGPNHYIGNYGPGYVWFTDGPVLNGSEPWVIAAVPEPGSLALMFLAAFGGMSIRTVRSRRHLALPQRRT